MDNLEKAISYFADAVIESYEILKDCSPKLKKELLEQQEHFKVALREMTKTRVVPPVIDKKCEEIGKCRICQTTLCVDDKDLNYCPTCGQKLK